MGEGAEWGQEAALELHTPADREMQTALGYHCTFFN
jgi:hypothetical protein